MNWRVATNHCFAGVPVTPFKTVKYIVWERFEERVRYLCQSPA